MKINYWILVLALGAQTVCATTQTGSLWSSDHRMYNTLYTDSSACSVGDLITIVVNLSTSTKKDKSMDTAKTTTFEDSITALGFSRGTDGTGQSDGDWDWFRFRDKNPAVKFDASQSHQGEGKIADTEKLTTTIQARVVDVLPNGTMQVEAKRIFEVGKEKSTLILSGLVRREDLGSGNTVSSTKIADLQITQEGVGPLSRSTKKGWLTTLYEYINPF
ncbi:MAG: flagellar basal body L-ring protein FlgH [Verrucomicrobiota bacterium]